MTYFRVPTLLIAGVILSGAAMTTAVRRIAFLALSLACAGGAFAQEEAAAVAEPARLALSPEIETAPQLRLDIPASWRTAQAEEKKLKPAGTERGPEVEWGNALRKSYAIPALEIVGFDTLLNLFNRAYFGCCDYDTNYRSIKRNLRGKWV